MITATCVLCNNKFGIKAEGTLYDHDGSTTDCSRCGKTLFIEDGKLKDFNEVLKQRYKEMGATINENHDYTKNYIEINQE